MKLRAPRPQDFERFLMAANARITEGQTKGRLGFPEERYRVLFIHDLAGLRIAFYRIKVMANDPLPLFQQDPDYTFIFSQMSACVADALMSCIDPERISLDWAKEYADPCPHYPVRSRVYCPNSSPVEGQTPTLPPPNPTG